MFVSHNRHRLLDLRAVRFKNVGAHREHRLLCDHPFGLDARRPTDPGALLLPVLQQVDPTEPRRSRRRPHIRPSPRTQHEPTSATPFPPIPATEPKAAARRGGARVSQRATGRCDSRRASDKERTAERAQPPEAAGAVAGYGSTPTYTASGSRLHGARNARVDTARPSGTSAAH